MFGQEKKFIPPVSPYKVYGTVGKSMSTDGFSRQFGQSATKSGFKGEQVMFDMLRNPANGWAAADMPVFCSLLVPGKSSDIDFALCRGDKILLLDAKYYRGDGGFYWLNKNGTLMRNFSKYTTSSGKNVNPSRSMVMAKSIISKQLPKHKVESLVVFVSDPKNPKAKAPNTMFLTYPGGVQTANERNAGRMIRRFFRGESRNEYTVEAEMYLKSLVQ